MERAPREQYAPPVASAFFRGHEVADTGGEKYATTPHPSRPAVMGVVFLSLRSGCSSSPDGWPSLMGRRDWGRALWYGVRQRRTKTRARPAGSSGYMLGRPTNTSKHVQEHQASAGRFDCRAPYLTNSAKGSAHPAGDIVQTVEKRVEKTERHGSGASPLGVCQRKTRALLAALQSNSRA